VNNKSIANFQIKQCNSTPWQGYGDDGYPWRINALLIYQ